MCLIIYDACIYIINHSSITFQLQTAAKLTSSGKGLLAADESKNTMGKRLKSIGVENSIEARQAYRELLLTCPGLGEYTSGVVLCEETLFQNCADGTPFVDCINNMGIIPGIKVDAGLSPLLGGHPAETWSCGLDGLAARAHEYYEKGARFAKWRAVIRITDYGAPSELAIEENSRGLAQYALAVQEAGLVPIVEPEILMDGKHSILMTACIQEKVMIERMNSIFCSVLNVNTSPTTNITLKFHPYPGTRSSLQGPFRQWRLPGRLTAEAIYGLPWYRQHGESKQS